MGRWNALRPEIRPVPPPRSLMVALGVEIRFGVPVSFVRLEVRDAHILLKDAGHSQFMSLGKRMADFHNLPSRFIRTKINSRADSNRAEVVRFLHSPKQHLIEL